jgi:hypothetical protein
MLAAKDFRLPVGDQTWIEIQIWRGSDRLEAFNVLNKAN